MRGTVANEPVVSQASTEEYRQGHERAFGAPDGSAKGGKWVWDERQGKLVPADEYVAPQVEGRVPVFTDRYMEGVQATDGTDIGSRAKRRRYMQENGLADYDDFSPAYRENEKRRFEREQDRERSAALKRAIYETKERSRRR